MSDFEINGADTFLALSKHLKQAGETDLRKELNRRLRTAAKPIMKAQKAAARADLPQSGGLAKRIAKAPLRAQVRTGKDPGVRIVAKGTDARATDQGRLRHPVFGNREVWVTQQVKPGWFTESGRRQLPEVRQEVQRALVDIAQEVARRG